MTELGRLAPPVSPPPRTTLALTAISAALALLGCSSQPDIPSQPPQLVLPSDSLAGPVLAVDPQRATFHGFDSKRVVAAAMTYPSVARAVEPTPPLSLTASDGTGLALTRMHARAVIDGPLAFTELRLRFKNPRSRVIEGRFAITLPPAATISRLAMKLPTGWQEAEVVEKQLARRAYEDFLHRRQDPALLEKEAGNEFRARIFPIPAGGDKDIIISYAQPLLRDHTGDATYRLPLLGLPAIAELQVSAQIGRTPATSGAPDSTAGLSYRTKRLEKRGEKPTSDFEVRVPAGIAGIAAGELLALRVRPQLSAEVQKISSLLILFDTSASRAPGFARQVENLEHLLDGLRARHGQSVRLDLAVFDQSVVPIYTGTLGGLSRSAIDKVRAHRPLGASNLSAALAWASTRASRARVIVIGDAIATMGPTGGEQLIARVRALGPATRRLDVVLAGGIRDDDMARRLARGTLARDGVVVAPDVAMDAAADKLSRTTVSGVQVAVAGAEWVWPTQLDGLQPGDEALVFASLSASRAGTEARVTLSGALEQETRVPLAQVARPLLERTAVGAHIARLMHNRDARPPADKTRRAELKQRIIDLSTRYRVLTDFTALLVLETENDYARYGIDRRALADILTVGTRGVEVLQRNSPVLMIAAPDHAKTPEKLTNSRSNQGKKDALEKRLARADDDDDDDDDDDSDYDARSDNRGDEPRVEELQKAQESRRALQESETRRLISGVTEESRARADLDSAIQEIKDEQERRLAPNDPAPVPTPEPEPEPKPEPVADIGAAAPPPPPPPPPARRRPASRPRPPANTDGVVAIAKPAGPPPYAGQLAEVMNLLERGQVEAALVQSLGWQSEKPGDVMALIALGESLERAGRHTLAARAYGSIIDLFPSRADMRRFAGERLERLDKLGLALAADSYAKAVEQRKDHLTGHRLLAYALVRTGDYQNAFAAIQAGLRQRYPSGRFAGGIRILREDLGLIGAAWIRAQPAARTRVEPILREFSVSLPDQPSLRFVLNWETDANDVDFHIHDGRGGHAFFSQRTLPSGGELYEDVTTGYGPECFTINGVPTAYPYRLQIHYYSRGPMGYGMGKLQIVEHDGAGNLRFEDRPFVVMNDRAYVDLGTVNATQPRASDATIAR